MIPMKSALQLS